VLSDADLGEKLDGQPLVISCIGKEDWIKNEREV